MMHTDSTHVNRKTAQADATRAELLRVARELFAARGYAAVGTEEIVRAAGVTRGALYHLFADKKALFAAVFEALEAELVERIAARALDAPDPLTGLRRAMTAWLDACAEPAVQRIGLVDAPAVLGWEEWRAVGERYGLGLTAAALEQAMAAGAIAPQPVRALAHVMVGAMDEAALFIARAEDPVAARQEAASVLARLVEGLRPSEGAGATGTP